MQSLLAHLPLDRLSALIAQQELPLHASGTVLGADLAGFTPLTEQLLRTLGSRRGAEELTRLLNEVYEPLIRLVHDHGGSVIAFSGDAMTCWFADPDPRPALACGLAMHQAMAAFMTLPLPIDPPGRLTLKVCIAAGLAQRFVVGDPAIQQFDLLAGPPLTRVAALDSLAQPGEVLVDAELVEQLDDQITVREWRSGPDQAGRSAVLISLAGPPRPRLERAPWPPTREEIDLRAWVAPAVLTRLQVAATPFLTELRPVVALFLGLGDADVASHPARLDAYVRRVQAVLASYDGTLLQITPGEKGSYLYAAFGAPVAHEDDTVRAIRAAQELIAMRGAGIGTVQIGIAQGVARTGVYGGRERRTYGVLGDAVNLAARLMQAARPGQILASDQVWRTTGGQFRWDLLPPLSIKGKQTTALVAQLNNATTAPPRLKAGAGQPPLVGRDQELAYLRDRLAQAVPAAGQLTVILGPAGIGKSRLLAALLHELPATWTVVPSAARSYAMASAYLCWIPFWQQVFGVDPAAGSADNLARAEAALARLVPASLPQFPLLAAVLNLAIAETDLTRALDPQLRKTWLEALLVQCLRADLAAQTARGQRLLLVLEDLHWIDQLSADLLSQIVMAFNGLPMTIVVTARPDDSAAPLLESLRGAAGCADLQLAELTPAAIGELLTFKFGQLNQALSPTAFTRLSQQISERAAGNPFYAEELVNYLGSSEDSLDARQDWDQRELPLGLHRLVLSRVDRLDDRERQVIKTASILGATFRRAWLWEVYPALGDVNKVGAAITTLEQVDLLTPSPDPALGRFKHAITQEVTYESLSHASRTALHEQVAVHLERTPGDPYLDLLAYHYARSSNDPKAIEYLARNAARAASLFANHDAVHQYQAAMARASQPGVDSPVPMPELARALGDVYAQMADFDHALEQYDRASADQRMAPLELAELDQRRTDVLVRATRYDEAMEVLARTEAAVQRADWSRQGQLILGKLAVMRALKAYRQNDYRESLASAQAGLDAIDRLPNDYPEVAATRSKLYQSLVSAAAALRDLQLAHKVLRRAFRLIRRYPQPALEGMLLFRRAMLALTASKLTRAARLFPEALRLVEATGSRDNVGALLIPAAYTCMMRGEVQQAERWFERGIALGEETGSIFLIAANLQNLAWLHTTRGDWEAALACTARVRQLAEQHGMRDRIVASLLIESALVLYLGDFAQAEALCAQGLELAERYELRVRIKEGAYNMARSALLQGDLERARSYRHDQAFVEVALNSQQDAIFLLASVEWWAMVALAGSGEPDPDEVALVTALTRKGLEFLRRHGDRYTLPFGYRTDAMRAYVSGQLDEAQTAANQGVASSRKMGRVPELARNLFWRGKTNLRRANGRQQAIRDLRAAAQIFAQLGMQPELGQANRALEEAMGSPPAPLK